MLRLYAKVLRIALSPYFSIYMVECPFLGSGAVALDEEYISTYFSHPLIKSVFFLLVFHILHGTIAQTIGQSNAVYFVYFHDVFF